MSKHKLIAVTLFGIEAVVSREIKALGYEVLKVENGRVTFYGDDYAICNANLWVRCAERILIEIGHFKALSFDDLFEGTKKLEWTRWLTRESKFPVKGYCLKSKLYSVPDCQSIIKKAVVENLKNKYKNKWFSEDGPLYQIQFSIYKDNVTLMIDTSGAGLHKRGYRAMSKEAPLRETLAAAMVSLSFWNKERALLDPFCGSGTIPIEAALIGLNRAPGLDRNFSFNNWPQIPKKLFQRAVNNAKESINKGIELNIKGSDIDKNAVKLAKHNSKLAGVSNNVYFEQRDVFDIKSDSDFGCIICNPPYGERLSDIKEVEKLYSSLHEVFSNFDTWSVYILTFYEDFEKIYGLNASKRRKLYNGMLKCTYYQYYGPPPQK